MDDSICALATPMGSGGIAVIRVSGRDCIAESKSLFSKNIEKMIANSVRYMTINDRQGDLIDDVLVSVFHGPNSFTGENQIEISCHCNRLIIESILSELNRLGIRLAEAGEFSKRAFLNGKMDLAQAEAIADLIASNNHYSLKNSRNILEGKLSKIVSQMREQMLKIAGLLEIDLDFTEEDLDIVDLQKVDQRIDESIKTIESFVRQSDAMRFINEGIKLSIVGRPNAGKSSLLNALLGRERAIVSDIEGTTRDTIEESISLDGITVRLIDTAGIRQSDDQIEKIGVEYSYRSIEKSDCVIILIDSQKEIHVDDQAIIDKCAAEQKRFVIAFNKTDLVNAPQSDSLDAIAVSAKTGIGLDLLKERIKALYQIDQIEANDDLVISNLRHDLALRNAVEHLKRAKTAIVNKAGNEIISVDIRQALDELATVTGEISSEDVLNDIFLNFCIGK
ncbi:MAG: tRNA uridine-5-carboxymethylaminomethyl(34) synthesis GTPase MnmE [Calditrichaeota bacterium]|nr:tRNA uridine-5-carboxymethylaminomethyl(34) synthesis GTPase MnmE [Calditrichota bacterium]